MYKRDPHGIRRQPGISARSAARHGTRRDHQCGSPSIGGHPLLGSDADGGWRQYVGSRQRRAQRGEEAPGRGVERIKERRHVECTGSIGYGDPVDEIENAARDFNADLVVIGTRKLGGLDRWWRKRIGKNLIDRLPCSLLIAIPPEDFEPSER